MMAKSDGNREYFYKSLIAGGVAGSVAKTLTAPLDRVKILFQAHNQNYVHYSSQPFGPFRAAWHIYQEFGVRGLYQGHTVMLMRIFPSAAVRFMAYEQIRMVIIPTAAQDTPWRHFVAGSLAGNCAVMVTYPLEVVRSRLAFEYRQKSQLKYGMLPTVRTIYAESGLRGFYSGFAPTMYGVIPYAGTAFSSYQYMRKWCKHQRWCMQDDDKTLRVPVHLLIGGLSGMLGQTVAYPFDTIRHRMQLYGVARATSINNVAPYPFYKHTWAAIVSIVKTEGWQTFFRGLSINWYKTMPANAVAFVTYDYLKRYLDISSESGVAA